MIYHNIYNTIYQNIYCKYYNSELYASMLQPNAQTQSKKHTVSSANEKDTFWSPKLLPQQHRPNISSLFWQHVRDGRQDYQLHSRLVVWRCLKWNEKPETHQFHNPNNYHRVKMGKVTKRYKTIWSTFMVAFPHQFIGLQKGPFFADLAFTSSRKIMNCGVPSRWSRNCLCLEVMFPAISIYIDFDHPAPSALLSV